MIWGAEALKEDLVTNASGEWRCILNGCPSHLVPQLLFSVNFFLFALHLTFFFFYKINYFNRNTYFLFIKKKLFRAFFSGFLPSFLVSTLFI